MARWSDDESRVPKLLLGGQYMIEEYQILLWAII